MAFRSKGQQWRKRDGNDDARYQIPDQGSIGHPKNQQSNNEEEKTTAFSKRLIQIFCLRSKATWLQECTELRLSPLKSCIKEFWLNASPSLHLFSV